MHDTLDVFFNAIRSTAAVITTLVTFSAVSMHGPRTSSCRSRTTRWCTASARGSTRCAGDAWQKYRARCATALRLHVRPPREEVCWSLGGEVRAAARAGAPTAASTGILPDEPAHRGPSGGSVQGCFKTIACSPDRAGAARAPILDGSASRWIDCTTTARTASSAIVRLARRTVGDFVVTVFNFIAGAANGGLHASRRAPRPAGTPSASTATASIDGGSNVGNQGGVPSEPIAAHGFDQSVSLTGPASRLSVAEETSLTGPRSHEARGTAEEDEYDLVFSS